MGNKICLGYKNRHVTDEKGLVLGVATTKAGVNEISNIEKVIDSCELPKGISLKSRQGISIREKRFNIKRTQTEKSHLEIK